MVGINCKILIDLFVFQIQNYITGIGNDVPLLLLGGPGSGKSSVMAKAADVAATAAMQGKIPGYITNFLVSILFIRIIKKFNHYPFYEYNTLFTVV